ncbi:MAG TPA: MnhB domain-containing protein [Polyangiaceae bacterium]|nr:MnhB domain-containing protein [Polyangiaceae bacterium]
MTSLLLRLASGVLLPLFLVLSAWFLERGHDEPGGGFTGGLVAVGGLVYFALVRGPGAFEERLRAASESVAALGILVAVSSGFVGPLFGRPFLTGIWWAPGFGTPTLFELGVYLLVVGGAGTALLALLSEET